MNMVSDSANALRMNSVLLCDTTEIRPEALSDLGVQDRNPFARDRGKDLQETLINRPYGTGRVFFLFSRHFVPGYPRFNPSGINA